MTKLLKALLLASLLQLSICFTVNCVSKSTHTALFETPADGMPSQDDDTEIVEEPPAVPAEARPLDPLVVSPVDSKETTNNSPLFGEIAVDGSLLVLAPATVIAVVGLVMSIVVGFNANDISVEDDLGGDAVVVQTSNQLPGECRGLCSSQGEQLETMRGFMEGLRKD